MVVTLEETMTDTLFCTYLVPDFKVEGFEKNLTKLVKAAIKCGCEPPTWQKVKTLSLPHPDRSKAKKGAVVEVTAITLRGTAPRLAGWEFSATLQHVGTETILRAVDGVNVPERFRTATPDDCDHCHKRRRRNDTYVVRNVETNEWLQVGSSCLADFLGHQDPHKIAKFATLLWSLANDVGGFWDDEEMGTRFEYVDLQHFLSVVGAVIEAEGWLSRTKAKEEGRCGDSTADIAWSELIAQIRCLPQKWRYTTDEQIDHYWAEAGEAREWAQNVHPDNDYLHNIRAIAKLGSTSCRLAGYAASIMTSFRRAKAKEVEAKVQADQKAQSRHVGEVGKRQDFTLTLTFTTSWESQFGTTTLYKFTDEDGNVFSWFSSRSIRELEIGKAFMVKGTVKAHEHYKGQAQTIITRCKVLGVALPFAKSEAA